MPLPNIESRIRSISHCSPRPSWGIQAESAPANHARRDRRTARRKRARYVASSARDRAHHCIRGALPGIPQIACFDTAFHSDMPRVAQLFAIPRRYLDRSVRRFGFHGLSYEYLMKVLTEQYSEQTATGRVVLMHLGSVRACAQFTMVGLSTRAWVSRRSPVSRWAHAQATWIWGTHAASMRTEGFTPEQMDHFLIRSCGLLGISDGTSDMRELLARRAKDIAAAEAVDFFCYQSRNFLGAYIAILGGLDTLPCSRAASANTRGDSIPHLQWIPVFWIAT